MAGCRSARRVCGRARMAREPRRTRDENRFVPRGLFDDGAGARSLIGAYTLKSREDEITKLRPGKALHPRLDATETRGLWCPRTRCMAHWRTISTRRRREIGRLEGHSDTPIGFLRWQCYPTAGWRRAPLTIPSGCGAPGGVPRPLSSRDQLGPDPGGATGRSTRIRLF
jgi:hypothetical protein